MSTRRHRVLFLYTELAGYFLTAVRVFAERYDVDVHIVRWPVHADAPFTFDLSGWAHPYERNALDAAGLLALAERLDPDFVYVAGWIDKGYRRAARTLRRRGVPVVCGMDTQWTGSLRQRLRIAAGRRFIRSCFSHAWIPGAPQLPLARRLGFREHEILRGLYTADVPAFAAAYETSRAAKAERYPRTLLYVGRFVAEKGVDELYGAYRALSARGQTNGWSLHLVGAGPLAQAIVPGGGVSIEGFRTANVPQLATTAGAFVLPSRREPWGVVLHEFAAAGLPLLASDACGARTAFVEESASGHVFPADDTDGLIGALERLFRHSDEDLLRMGERSHQLALALTPDVWADTAATLLPR